MLKLFGLLKLRVSLMFHHLITPCFGIFFSALQFCCPFFMTPLNLIDFLPRRGHATLISEVAASLGPAVKPGAVLLSVGGGGLLCGIVQGLEDVGWLDVPIIAMETVGADCFNAAVKAGKLVTLDDITRSGSKVRCFILEGFPRRRGPTFCFLLHSQ